MIDPSRSNVADLTAELKLAASMLAVHRGLYIQYLRNDAAHAVYDRNGERAGRGKLLIPPNGRTIKIGKFVGGFLARRAQDALHMHRRSAEASAPAPFSTEFVYPPALGTYIDCLERILVLDLGSAPKDEVAEAERTLRSSLDTFLRDHGIAVQDRRGDWRILDRIPGSVFLEKLDAWGRECLGNLETLRR